MVQQINQTSLSLAGQYAKADSASGYGSTPQERAAKIQQNIAAYNRRRAEQGLDPILPNVTATQTALQNADLDPAERDRLQAYLNFHMTGDIADLAPALSDSRFQGYLQGLGVDTENPSSTNATPTDPDSGGSADATDPVLPVDPWQVAYQRQYEKQLRVMEDSPAVAAVRLRTLKAFQENLAPGNQISPFTGGLYQMPYTSTVARLYSTLGYVPDSQALKPGETYPDREKGVPENAVYYDPNATKDQYGYYTPPDDLTAKVAAERARRAVEAMQNEGRTPSMLSLRDLYIRLRAFFGTEA